MGHHAAGRPPGALIVAGLGCIAAFERTLQALGGLPDRVVVIEPSVTQGGDHARGLAAQDGVTVLDGCPAASAGTVELLRYNLPGLRSAADPAAALRDLFPGLRARARVRVRGVPLAEAFAALDADCTPLALHLDLPGAEPELLQALDAGGQLAAIDRISLRCAAEAVFEGAWTRSDLAAWLDARHFTLYAVDDTDPDWPELGFARSPAARRVRELEAEMEALRDATAREVAALETERAAERERADTAVARCAAAESAQETAEAARAEAERSASATAETLAETEAARAALEAELGEVRAQHAAAQERLETERAAAKAAQEARDKAAADLGVALRMQGLLQSDLADLRARFRDAEDTRLTQEALLRSLAPWLETAAHHLRQATLVPDPDAALAIVGAAPETGRRASGAASSRRKATDET
ncbi:hypothetical protein [Rhodosalinus sediminis]|uniref:hypothetical protein n=1 Tax=Rhodosalinus sediminis TaxID=1940533 RepID=UPI0023537F43|nr:hypothetical protein [Rhodosalinus sediminis]